MRILIDLQGAQNHSRQRGIGRYSLALARGILKKNKHHNIYILLNGAFANTIEPIRNELADVIAQDHILVFNSLNNVEARHAYNEWRTQAAELIREKFIHDFAPDVLLICSLFEGMTDKTITSIGASGISIPTAVVLYDLIPLLNPEIYLTGIWYDWYYKKLSHLQRANLLLAISESSALEARDYLEIENVPVVNISSGVDCSFNASLMSSSQKAQLLNKFNIHKKFIMHASALDPRKNFEGLLRAFAALPALVREDFQLVLVFKVAKKSPEEKYFYALAEELGLKPSQLVLTGYVSDEELIGLYASCYLFVFPSFHEGFGLPAAEAMACGAATIGSSITSIPEVIGREDALFDPYSIKEMTAILNKAIVDDEYWHSLKKHASSYVQKFSWDRTAELALDAIENRFSTYVKMQEKPIRQSTSDFAEQLTKINTVVRPNENDYLLVAKCLYVNETLLNVVKAKSSYVGMMSYRLQSNSSTSYVTTIMREITLNLRSLGHKITNNNLEQADIEICFFNGDIELFNECNVYQLDNSSTKILFFIEMGICLTSLTVNYINTNFNKVCCSSMYVSHRLVGAGITIPIENVGFGIDQWERVTHYENYLIDDTKKFKYLFNVSEHNIEVLPQLLTAYGYTFTAKHKVTLILHTPVQFEIRAKQLLVEQQSKIKYFPHTLIIKQVNTSSELKSLFNSCAAFLEFSTDDYAYTSVALAMLSELPVIVPDFAAYPEFCHSKIGWLIKIRSQPLMCKASMCAHIDTHELSENLKKAFKESPKQLKLKGHLGRREMLYGNTWKQTTSKLVLI